MKQHRPKCQHETPECCWEEVTEPVTMLSDGTLYVYRHRCDCLWEHRIVPDETRETYMGHPVIGGYGKREE